MPNWKEIVQKIYEKERAVATRLGGKIPYTADENGMFVEFVPRDIGWWTNGFYAGLLWQLYAFRRTSLFRATAERIERRLDENLANAAGLDHDSGFKWLLTSGASFTLTGSAKSKNRLLLAANDLAGRFNPAGNFLRAWNDESGEKAGWAIIDCMMNLPLLYRASALTHDPRFSHIAIRHAETAQRFFVRDNGSCAHIAVFDPQTGAFLKTLGGQGMGEGSAWTRGQAWALYGFTLSHLHTGRADFLETAERVARYFLAHIPENALIPVDFAQPADCDFEDDSAAAIAACGLLELSRATENQAYRAAAERFLSALLAKRCDFSAQTDRILTHCSAAYHEEKHNYALVYGDYFFTEAVLKLLNKEIMVW